VFSVFLLVIRSFKNYSAGTVMFQLRRRTEYRPSSSLQKSGSVDDVKVPRILPAAVQPPGKLIFASFSSDYTVC